MQKRRKVGLTLARDYGIGFYEAQDWMESVGGSIDYIKMRHISTLRATSDPDDLLMRKVRLYRRHRIEVDPGRIVFEIAFIQRQLERTLETLCSMGFSAVECSENIIPLSLREKIASIKAAKQRGLKVMFEIGEKYPDGPLDVGIATKDIKTMLENGCDLVIVERSLIEQSLGARGESKEAARLEQLVANVGLEPLVWEAEAVPHQAWLIQTFGADVNLGPISSRTTSPSSRRPA